MPSRGLVMERTHGMHTPNTLARLPRFAAALLALACLAQGCGKEKRLPCEPRQIGDEALGALAPAALRAAYATPAFCVRGDARGAVQDTDLLPEPCVDDANLIVFVEGAGDTVAGFRRTAALLAESPCAFPGRGDPLAVVLLHWSESANPVSEHLNRDAQRAGAGLLNHILEVHRRRHAQDGAVSIVAFSAGTRVTEFAFSGNLPEGATAYREALDRVENVVYLGSSVWREDPTPYENIRGRFINFVNPRDTHFGDRSAYAAPAGESPRFGAWLKQGTLVRNPGFGASVAGFRRLPTLTAADQFDALDAAPTDGPGARVRQAFKRVNVPVPDTLIAYNLFGQPVPDDGLDDYVNEAPNHYVLVGRGPAGAAAGAVFAQYESLAAEFVRDFVAAAALKGRVDRFALSAKPHAADPLGVPLPVPWAVIRPSKGEPNPAPTETAPTEPAP